MGKGTGQYSRWKQCLRIRILFFQTSINMTFYVFWNDVKKVFSRSLVLNPSKWVHTLRSVITVIVPSSPNVIHSEPLLNILVTRSWSSWLRCRRHLQVQLSETGQRMTLFTTENETVWLRPEPVILSTSIQTSDCCRSCSRSITRKQTSSGNVGQCQILTAVNSNNKH